MFGNELSYDLQVDGLKLADIPANGGLAEVFTSPGKVLEDTIEVNPDDPTTNSFFAQGESTPLMTTVKAGITKGSCTLVKVTTEVAADLLNGEVKDGQYHAPRSNKGVYKALQITDGNGTPYTYPRVLLFAKVVGKFRVGEMNSIQLSWQVQVPTDGVTAPEIIGKKVVAGA